MILELGIFIIVLGICLFAYKIIIFPMSFLLSLHLPNVLDVVGISQLPTWAGLGVVLALGAWLLGDR